MPAVLIVEDEKHILELAATNLRKRGYEILEAQTAQDGLGLLKKYRPNLLILDIKLPGKSGWDMLREIDSDKELTKLPVIIMSASASTNVDSYLYPNIVGRIYKPFGIANLLDLVATSIEQ